MRSHEFRRCTSPTAIIARRAPLAPERRFSEGRHSAQPLGDGADFNTFLAVAFPHDQVQILPYNRIVKDLGGLNEHAFMQRGSRSLRGAGRTRGAASRGDIAMYFMATGRRFVRHVAPDRRNAIASLDVSVLQDQPAGARPEDCRHPHRQADRFRRRRARHQRARETW